MKLLTGLFSLFLVFGSFSYAASSSRNDSPEVVVQSLYRDFGWEIKSDISSKKLLIDQPVRVLNRFFTPKLAELIKKDRNHEIKTKDLGHLDFVLLCGSQDPDGINNLRITKKSGTNIVAVLYDQNGEKDVMQIDYYTVHTQSGWRISNIHYKERKSTGVPDPQPEFSLLKLLSQPY